MEDDAHSRAKANLSYKFQSTSPVWRTTLLRTAKTAELSISIHVPRVEDDEIRCSVIP